MVAGTVTEWKVRVVEPVSATCSSTTRARNGPTPQTPTVPQCLCTPLPMKSVPICGLPTTHVSVV